ncbi:thioredoxin-like domain-containing protein [Adhaeretor mobilis]|uniref:Thiol-disulfide oxidoreductase ResA n=1 Tax=Adhaeretor mobilis TaxID=1930276 RepID=A0A517MYI0_9BACT|nr:thioredoxin-like domain-containing protein [Adhaeretor mobilis]QDS99934.1 Thiol-disulfide oxidoreductase ResA [Adhaeretor mobilis]
MNATTIHAVGILRRPVCQLTVALGMLALCAGIAQAAPSVADALKLKPVQNQVDYDTPESSDIEKCAIKAEKINGMTAWVVRGPNGNVLRQFADTNGDNVVDAWSYFLDGLEVYRDIDGDFNGKADQYRWFQTAGSRWGSDRNEDGNIDSWKLISPEEVAEEAVEAARSRNPARFARLLITEADLKELGMSKTLANRIRKRASSSAGAFKALVQSGDVGKQSTFSDFGGMRPGMVPAGTLGLKGDLLVYENVWAMVSDGQKHEQLQLGTMVRVNDSWKLIDGPTIGSTQQAAAPIFFDTGGGGAAQQMAGGGEAASDEVQAILVKMEKLDVAMGNASPTSLKKLIAERADVLEELVAKSSPGEEKEQWLRQLADMLSASVQDRNYPEGADRLKRWVDHLAKEKASKNIQTYFIFRSMQADYGAALAAPKADYSKVHSAWLKQLEAFVDKHGSSEHAAEALLQLAMASEISGETEESLEWYDQLAKNFPNSQQARKAKGAMTRLTSEGKAISLKGKTVDGRDIDLKMFRGKPVVIQYWISSYKSCKAEHAVLKDLYGKFGGKNFEVIGVNLDYTRQEVEQYLKSNPLKWPQVYESGGFDSRLANEMGVNILPLMMVVDANGKVSNRSVQAAELETELKKVMK